MAHNHRGDWHVCNHLRARNFSIQCASIATSASILSLDDSSPSNIILTGTTAGQVVMLGDATTYQNGHEYRIFNESTQPIEVKNADGDTIGTILPGTHNLIILCGNTTTAGNWIIGQLQLSRILVDESNISGVSGGNAQLFLENLLELTGIPIKNEFPIGKKNCSNLLYETTFEFIPGTLEVFLDGNKLTQGLDYAENVDHKGFSILLSSATNRLSSAPKFDEDLVVSYCRKVIFY